MKIYKQSQIQDIICTTKWDSIGVIKETSIFADKTLH